MGQKQRLLLLDDIDALGRSGDVVEVKKGFARNFLLPQQKATFANKHTLRMQTRLKEERAKQAEVDLKDSQELAKKIEKSPVITLDVKVDPEGHLYGSVSASDIANRMKEEHGLEVDKKFVNLQKPIKELGSFNITLSLKEDVQSQITVNVKSEEYEKANPKKEIKEEPKKEEEETQEETE